MSNLRRSAMPKLLIILVLLWMALLPQPIHAQDPPIELPNTYITHDGSLSFQIPQGWSVTRDYPRNTVLLSNGPFEESVYYDLANTDSLVIGILPSDDLSEAFGENETPNTPREALEIISIQWEDAQVAPDIEESALNEYPVASANFENANFMGEFHVLDLNDGDFVMLYAVAAINHYTSDHHEIVLSIASTMIFHEYESGDFRLVTAPEQNLVFEMPAEYVYDDTEDSEVHFGSDLVSVNSSEISKGQFVGVISGVEFLEETGEISIESTEQVLSFLYFALSTDGEAEDVEFGEPEHVIFEGQYVTEALQFTFSSTTVDNLLLVFEMPDGRILMTTFSASGGELSDFEDTITQIVTSIRPFNTTAPDNEDDES